MKKKAIKLIFINIFFILSLFLVIEYAIYKKAVVDYKNHHNGIAEIIPPPTFLESYKIQYYPQTIQYFNTQKKLDIRPFERNKDNTKKPILIFGCSFANGSTFLEDKQAPAHKLSKLTKRNVYNFAMNGCGLQHMLYITQHCLEKYMPQNEKPEFAIYFYIPNHLQRLQVNIFPNIFFNGTVLHYNLKNSQLKLEQKNNSFIYQTFLTKWIYYTIDKQREINIEQNKHYNFVLTETILKETKKELETRYPNIKFIIVRYQIEDDDTFREVPNMWEKLEQEGFTIINSEDLIGRKFKYQSEDTTIDKYHPSEKAWDILLPPLIKKINIQ